MSQITQEKLREMYHKDALEDGVRAIENVRQVFADAAEKVANYMVTYKQAVAGETACTPEDVLGWVVNHATSNVLNNTRCDLILSVAAKIAKGS